jgi:hypothetical protein
VKPGSYPLLNSTYLTAPRYAHWIDFRTRTDGLDAAARDELKGVTIQTQVLTLASNRRGPSSTAIRREEACRSVVGQQDYEDGSGSRQAALPLMPDPRLLKTAAASSEAPSKKHSATSTIRRFVAEWQTC